MGQRPRPLHLARASCRTAERQYHRLAVTLRLQYFNRLADYLFAAARFENHQEGH